MPRPISYEAGHTSEIQIVKNQYVRNAWFACCVLSHVPSRCPYLGKIDTFSGDANAFAHEWKTQFMSPGFGPNPVTFRTVPYATLGAGVLLRPTDAVLINVSALSPDGT